MKLSELFLNRYLYRDNNQNSETKDSAFVSTDSSEAEASYIASGGAAADVNTGNVMIDGDLLPDTTINVGDWGWTQSSVFASIDTDTVNWGAGTFLDAAGNSYSIDAGTTGNMAAKTYIYLSLLDSETVYQTSTTSSDAVGVGKVLIAVAENEADAATFNLTEANQIVGDNILANTINAGKIVSGSITTTQLSFTPLYSSGGTGAVIGTINASVEGINISADRINISGLTTFSAGYDPTGKVPATGAAADVVANITTIDGGHIRTGEIDSQNYAYTAGNYSDAGMRIDLDDGSIRAKTFAIDSSGNAYFKGALAAGSGTIGGWKIDSNAIYTGTKDSSGYTSAPGDITLYSDGTNSSIHAYHFLIDVAGNITATSVTLSGSITATSGSITGSLVTTGINASNITTGTLSVGAAGQPGSIILNRDGSNGFLTWTGGNKIWSDANEYMGFDAGGGRYYFYDDTVPMVLFQNNSQAIFYDGINSEGNFNVGAGYAARFEGIPIYLYSSGTNCRIEGSSTVISYEAPNDHNFYVGGAVTVDAVIDNNIWTAGDLLAAGSKTFIIDHPDGKKDKLLRYTAQESPEVILRHRGKATTDGTGKITISLPDHYTMITDPAGDVTVNLTCVGSAFIFLQEEPTNAEIKVESSIPNISFHYEVIAIRAGYLNAKVEIDDKDITLNEKDRYLVDRMKKRKETEKDNEAKLLKNN